MTVRLDPRSARQIRTLLESEAPTLVDMAREIGEDPATFFEGEDWSGLDLRPCDLAGISFAGAVMDGVTVHPDQERTIRATRPKSMEGVVVVERPTPPNPASVSPEAEARTIIDRLDRDAPDDPFEALRTLQVEWYERGRDEGLAFDLEVSIALARETLARVRDADQRGIVLNDLGNALATLGERETGTERLDEAVAAYREALKERTRERVPLDWAATQNNLGTALATLGERETGTGRLHEAVSAFREALKERTRERVPLDWAMTWNNLGTALKTLGERETGTGRLEEAVAAYREALEERTRERVPLQWAFTQANIGILAITRAERLSDAGTAREAVDALSTAMEVFRDAGADAYVAQGEPSLRAATALHARLRAGKD